jgi:hypothetical protein
MANIAVATAGEIQIVVSIQQHTFPAAEAIVAGAPVRIDTTAGTVTNANGTTTTENRVWGIATKSVAAGEVVTVVRRGFLDGFTLAGNYDSAVYLSDTDGRLGDTAGTVSTIVGRVVPGFGHLLGSSPDKLLSVEL